MSSWWLGRLTVGMLGVALLLPWNAHIKAISYLRMRLKGTTLHSAFPNYITSTFSIVNTVSVFVNTVVLRGGGRGRGCGGGGGVVAERRVLAGFALNMAMVAIVMVLLIVDGVSGVTWMGPSAFFTVWLAVVAATGLAASLLQQGGFGLVGRMSAEQAPWFLGGQGVAGSLVSLAALLSQLVGTGDDDDGHHTIIVSVLYFFMAFLLLLLASALFLVACKRHICGLHLHGREDCKTDGLVDGKQDNHNSSISWSLFESVKWHCIGIWLTFFITLSLFPFTVTLFKTEMALFAPLGFLAFDFGDLVGKALPSIVPLPSESVILIVPWIRVLFVPLLLMGKYGDNNHNSRHVYSSPLAFLMIMFSMAVTSGLSNTWLLMTAPKHVKGQTDKETVGSLIGMFLILGISTGSIASFGWRHVVLFN